MSISWILATPPPSIPEVPVLTSIYQIVGIASAAGVFFTVPIAILTLRRVVLQRRGESLLRVIEELRDPDFRALAAQVYSHFPVPASLPLREQLTHFAEARKAIPAEGIDSAIQLVNRLNNIAALIEQGAVREGDLHGQTHPRVIEIAARLNPFILIRSAEVGFRWGMRVRRLGTGAANYYRTNTLHNRKPLIRSDVVLVEAATGLRWRFTKVAFRGLILRKFMPTARTMRAIDEAEVAEARLALLPPVDTTPKEPTSRLQRMLSRLSPKIPRRET